MVVVVVVVVVVKTLERLKHVRRSRAGPYVFLTLKSGSSLNDTNQNCSYNYWLKF